MSRTLRRKCSPVFVVAFFLAGYLVEGARLNDVHTRIAVALQDDDVPLQTIQFVSASPVSKVQFVPEKCTRQRPDRRTS